MKLLGSNRGNEASASTERRAVHATMEPTRSPSCASAAFWTSISIDR